MNPIVGQQVILNPDNRNRPDVQARLDLLIERALVTNPRPECDLVATAVLNGQTRRWVFNANEKFVPGDRATPSLTRSELLSRGFCCLTAFTSAIYSWLMISVSSCMVRQALFRSSIILSVPADFCEKTSVSGHASRLSYLSPGMGELSRRLSIGDWKLIR